MHIKQHHRKGRTEQNVSLFRLHDTEPQQLNLLKEYRRMKVVTQIEMQSYSSLGARTGTLRYVLEDRGIEVRFLEGARSLMFFQGESGSEVHVASCSVGALSVSKADVQATTDLHHKPEVKNAYNCLHSAVLNEVQGLGNVYYDINRDFSSGSVTTRGSHYVHFALLSSPSDTRHSTNS
jgi:hypothetical protein